MRVNLLARVKVRCRGRGSSLGRGAFAPDRIEARYRSSPCVHDWRFMSFQHPLSALGESPVNANVNPSANGIAAQPSPSRAVHKFLALKPRLFINGEWVHSVGQLPQSGGP